MLVLTRKTDESITIGHDVTVTILEIRGNQVRLGVKAPRETAINRTEIYESITRENVKASETPEQLDGLPEILNLKNKE